jgi:D-aminoacyl-tRNA deacylase
MRAVVQRVLEAAVRIAGEEVGRIGAGLLVFLGVGQGDRLEDVDFLVEKVVHLRVFPDLDDKMNRSLLDIGGGVLVVSQFTLWGDCRKGRRPSFAGAAPPDHARSLYEAFVKKLRDYPIPVETGKFQEMMAVHLINDGPVTLLLDSRKAF